MNPFTAGRRIRALEAKIEFLEKTIEELESTTETLEQDINDPYSGLSALQNQLEQVDLEKMDSTIDEHGGEIETIKEDIEDLDQLTMVVVAIARRMRLAEAGDNIHDVAI